MFNRLVEPDRGEVEIEGKRAGDLPAPELRRRIGYVVQGLSLFPRFTVAQALLEGRAERLCPQSSQNAAAAGARWRSLTIW